MEEYRFLGSSFCAEKENHIVGEGQIITKQRSEAVGAWVIARIQLI